MGSFIGLLRVGNVSSVTGKPHYKAVADKACLLEGCRAWFSHWWRRAREKFRDLSDAPGGKARGACCEILLVLEPF
jgi:hypothetical protein